MSDRKSETPPEDGAASRAPGDSPSLGDFTGDPTRSLADWHWLFDRDEPFPIRSDRGVLGRLLVGFKRLLRPVVKTPQNDLWERQRVFNLILLERLQEMESDVLSRLEHLEAFRREGLDEVMRHGDALFSRVDQKLDRQSRETRELAAQLRGGLALLEEARGPGPVDPTGLRDAVNAAEYVAFEHRFRGSEEEIASRVGRYVERLKESSPVLDLGCGRGEALAVLEGAGISCSGVDSNAEMVRQCTSKGLHATQSDLVQLLADTEAGSLGGVVSFHVIEHLDWEALRRVLELSARALRPGGIVLFETPNPKSIRVGASDFWRDATHIRPVHPDAVASLCRAIGFESVEIAEVNDYPEEGRLPEVETPDDASPDLAVSIDQVNRLRDRLDDLLHGPQDFALIATKS